VSRIRAAFFQSLSAIAILSLGSSATLAAGDNAAGQQFFATHCAACHATEQDIHEAVRDTVLVTAMGRIRIAFDADNPGRWAFHCHSLYHMVAGMMTELRYQGIAG
jgi:FtsP/CotA-like multicopper oxidase with cupredoxin domain